MTLGQKDDCRERSCWCALIHTRGYVFIVHIGEDGRVCVGTKHGKGRTSVRVYGTH